MENSNSQVTPSVPQSELQKLDDHSALIILLLVFVYPVGLIFMFIFARAWPKWLKIVLLIPFVIELLAFIGIFTVFIISASNPNHKPQNTIQPGNSINLTPSSTLYNPSPTTQMGIVTPTPIIFPTPTAIPGAQQ